MDEQIPPSQDVVEMMYQEAMKDIKHQAENMKKDNEALEAFTKYYIENINTIAIVASIFEHALLNYDDKEKIDALIAFISVYYLTGYRDARAKVRREILLWFITVTVVSTVVLLIAQAIW